MNTQSAPLLARIAQRAGLFAELIRKQGPTLEASLYAGFAVFWTLMVANDFFTSLRFQLFLSESRAGFESTRQAWSAPLDDVFIHFDFARSAARGFPFQWSEGNGYSSGGTSLLYPFVLAVGYRLGYTSENLMLWAGMLACASVVFCLLKARSLFAGLPRYCSWVLPPALLSTGVLNWSLFSGMEVAFLLAIWAAALVAFFRLQQAPRGADLRQPALSLGLWCLVLTATRPETAVTVACFTVIALAKHVTSQRPLSLLLALLLAALPGALLVIGQAVANRLLTGDFSAAGALVKLELNDPYLTRQDVLDAWLFHFKYQIARITQYHFSSEFFGSVGSGWAAWLLAAFPLLDKRTRTASLLLWASMFTFMAVVALNGQVRWQNERYAMPAVAWLLLNAALGAGLSLAILADALMLARRLLKKARGRAGLIQAKAGCALTIGALGASLVGVFIWGQGEAYAGQRWFFGRASRNIWDQHIAVAKRLRHVEQAPSRVLVGDAGAIPYVADLPALDIIGLGGYHDLPFARAMRFGIGAGIELIERMPAHQRPDLMAIYPSWWGELPLWFGRELWAVGVRGNVICGGAYKVVYQADWSALEQSQRPFFLKRHDRLRGELDIADVVSERQSAMHLHGAPGFVQMKLLPRLDSTENDLWDAGRLLPSGASLSFGFSTLRPHQPLELIVRTAPAQEATLAVFLDGHPVGTFDVQRSTGWQELRLDLAAQLISQEVSIRLAVTNGELVLYHVWGVQER